MYLLNKHIFMQIFVWYVAICFGMCIGGRRKRAIINHTKPFSNIYRHSIVRGTKEMQQKHQRKIRISFTHFYPFSLWLFPNTIYIYRVLCSCCIFMCKNVCVFQNAPFFHYFKLNFFDWIHALSFSLLIFKRRNEL